jgi:hypothetical protein
VPAAVTQAFQDVWARRTGKQARVQLRYQRRRFDADAVAYVYESDWHTLSGRDYVTIGDIVYQLDVDEPNVFKSTTITLRLKNLDNRWTRSVNDPSVFAADGVAEDGWDDRGTRFQVRWAYKLDDGTFEYTPLFTGYAIDFLPDSDSGTVDVPCSATFFADTALASRLVDTVTQEACTPSPGDGTNANFLTASTGVLTITNAYLYNAATSPATTTELEIGIDCTITISTTGGKATITLNDPSVASGKTVKWSGTKGRQGLKIEEIIAECCDAAGIDSGSRTIEPVIYPGAGLSASRTIDTEADWTSGGDLAPTLSGLTATGISGSLAPKWYLIDDFTDLQLTSNPAWTVLNYSAAGEVNATSGYLWVHTNGHGGGIAAISLPFAFAPNKGSLAARILFDGTGGGEVMLLDTNSNDGFGNPGGNGYSISSNRGVTGINFNRVDGGSTVKLLTLISHDTSWHDYRITRTADGLWEIFVDGVSKGTVTDATYETTNYIYVRDGGQGTGVDDLYYSHDLDGTGTIVVSGYAEYLFNIGSTPTALGRIDHLEVLNSGSVTLKTATAPDSAGSPGTFEALQDIDASGLMQSTPQQWLKVRVEIGASSVSMQGAEVRKFVASFSTSSVTVTLWNPRGSCMDEMKLWAKIAGYDFGFDPDGTLFFRSPSVSATPDFTLSHQNALSRISDWSNGYDRVRNVARVAQGDYVSIYDKTTAGEAEPTSERRFGPIEVSESYDGVMLANDVNLRQARAQSLFANLKEPKIRFRSSGKIVPHARLADVTSSTFTRDPKLLRHVAGDPLMRSGYAGPAGVVVLNAKTTKLVGVTYKPDYGTCDLQHEEVLS